MWYMDGSGDIHYYTGNLYSTLGKYTGLVQQRISKTIGQASRNQMVAAGFSQLDLDWENIFFLVLEPLSDLV